MRVWAWQLVLQTGNRDPSDHMSHRFQDRVLPRKLLAVFAVVQEGPLFLPGGGGVQGMTTGFWE